MIDKNHPCIMKISRLLTYISMRDVCNYIGIQVIDLTALPGVEPSNEWKEEHERDREYHLRKIKYYVENGIESPIDIDCLSRQGDIHPFPIIMDGRHRYIAAIL